MSEPSRALVVFARDPQPGRAKTRLAPLLGAEGAADLYAAFVSDLAQRLATAPFPVRWAVAEADRLQSFAARFSVPRERCFAQSGGDLGARMRHAFGVARECGAESVVLIGSDAPQVPLARLAEAFESLDAAKADVVLGPACDGGYYLIAMARLHDVFAGVTWSTSSVLAQTEARAAELGLRVARLAEDFDVDEPADLERLRRLLGDPDAAHAMPATAATLRRLLGSDRS